MWTDWVPETTATTTTSEASAQIAALEENLAEARAASAKAHEAFATERKRPPLLEEPGVPSRGESFPRSRGVRNRPEDVRERAR